MIQPPFVPPFTQLWTSLVRREALHVEYPTPVPSDADALTKELKSPPAVFQDVQPESGDAHVAWKLAAAAPSGPQPQPPLVAVVVPSPQVEVMRWSSYVLTAAPLGARFI
jgi:hypothetical protein